MVCAASFCLGRGPCMIPQHFPDTYQTLVPALLAARQPHMGWVLTYKHDDIP